MNSLPPNSPPSEDEGVKKIPIKAYVHHHLRNTIYCGGSYALIANKGLKEKGTILFFILADRQENRTVPFTMLCYWAVRELGMSMVEVS